MAAIAGGNLARLAGVEPTTPGIEAPCSIHLSYKRINNRYHPATHKCAGICGAFITVGGMNSVHLFNFLHLQSQQAWHLPLSVLSSQFLPARSIAAAH